MTHGACQYMLTWIWQTTVRRTFAYDGRYAWSQSDAYQVFVFVKYMYTTDFAYDGPIFLVPLSPSYPSSPVCSCVQLWSLWCVVASCLSFLWKFALSYQCNRQRRSRVIRFFAFFTCVILSVCFFGNFMFPINSSNAETTFVQSTRTQSFLKNIESLSCWYSLDSSRWVLSGEYPFARVSVIIQVFCIILYWPNSHQQHKG